ncbi:MAG: TerC family protein [Myxococcales bacterium]|nr:TerC family protein [Myxococcales bacterium]
MTIPVWVQWTVFIVLVVAMLGGDLFVMKRLGRALRKREALLITGIYVAIAMLFGVFVYFARGGQSALEFYTGYLLEESLSIDNLFVFVIIFRQFKVPKELEHKVLMWGIVGAFILRLLFIVLGVALITRFAWLFYVFGAFLIYTGIKLLWEQEHTADVTELRLVRWLRKLFPVTDSYRGDRLFVVEAGRRMATPLFVVILVIEASDVMFALDSIPAIFSITTDTFIIYTSNIFAILGLRALYAVLGALVERFHHLRIGIAGILIFVGVKLGLANHYHMPTVLSLGIIAGALIAAVVASLLLPPKPTTDA